MKNLFLVLFLSIIVSCQNPEKKEVEKVSDNEDVVVETVTENVPYANFGEALDEKDALTEEELSNLYTNLKVGDSINVKIASTINSVCKKKGCWMKLAVSDEQETMVRFKDYGFFVPKNAEGRKTVVEGVAFLDETSVEDLKHYAEDEGKSQEEIDAITAPKITYSFTAVGALVQGTEEDFKGQVEGVKEDAEQEKASE
ncbi:DUF4920 domain-containing protein [Psychroflexus salis]|uniref:DUF4920 domain-containing protein n=1 Tax=Psychroflexus salis TaxID=1526574 RepID=A0A917EA78_9FLAO|nr:DUF4920 domain-containing protein [Psychroflexus salis]GGE14293.1 hypothetical protein GCM10010831_14580 [Psychroflexus salis]